MMSYTLSLIVITKNEAHNIERCLRSVPFATEIIVFDSGSTDNTVELAKAFTPNVFVTADWPGDGPQKNRALQKATSDYVLCLDADEELSPPLAKEMQALLAAGPKADAYEIPYISSYCGKRIYHGDWRGEKHVRFFKRTAAKFTEKTAHCRLEGMKKTLSFKHPVYHYPFPNLERVLAKINEYSSVTAGIKFAQRRQGGMTIAIVRGLWAFIRGFILKLGFLDGREGFILAVSNAEGTYYRYLKLMYLNEKMEK